MKTTRIWTLALAGAAMLAVSPARAQTNYTPGDLLLVFRDPSALSGNDLVVDAGPVTGLQPGVLASSALVEGVFGTIGTGAGDVSVGFSAAAADAPGTDGILWLTRADSVPGPQPGVVSAQQTYSSQNPVAVRIDNIGAGFDSGTAVSGANNARAVSGGAIDSYQTQGQQSASSPEIIDFNGFENVNSTRGGNIETVQDGSGNVYEALWKVPATTTLTGVATGATDTYLGYFTFKPNGEVDFSLPGAAPQNPTLTISLASDKQHVVISWSPAGNTLYSSPTLGAGSTWTAVGTANPTTLPISGSAGFFYVGK